MWYFVSESFLEWLMIFGAVYLVWMLVKGMKGERIDEYPYCVSCDYCLHGLDKADVCVECGAELGGVGTVRIGQWEKRGKYVWRGLLVMGLCLVFVVGAGMVEMGHKSVGWLMYDLGRVDAAVILVDEYEKKQGVKAQDVYYGKTAGDLTLLYEEVEYEAIWLELVGRVKAGLLSEGEVAELIEYAMARIDIRVDSRGGIISQGYNFGSIREIITEVHLGFIYAMREMGRLDDDVFLALVRQMVSFEMGGREDVPMEMGRYVARLNLGVWEDRQGMVGVEEKLKVKLKVVGMKVGGVDVGFEETRPMMEKGEDVTLPGYTISEEGRCVLDLSAVRAAGLGVGKQVVSAEIEVRLVDGDGADAAKWVAVVKNEISFLGEGDDVLVVKDKKYLAGIYERFSGIGFTQYVCSKTHHHFNSQMKYAGGGLGFDMVFDVYAVVDGGEPGYMTTLLMRDVIDGVDGDDFVGCERIKGFENVVTNKEFGRKAWFVGKKVDLLLKVNMDAGFNHEGFGGRVWGGEDLLFRGIEVIETRKGE